MTQATRKAVLASAATFPPPPVCAPWPPPRPSPDGEALYTDILAAQGGSIPPPSNRFWMRGNFSGIHVPGLVPVPGGSSDPTLVFAPFLGRYPLDQQAQILEAYAGRGYMDYLLSWPNSKNEDGWTIDQYVDLAVKVASQPALRGGVLRPIHMLSTTGTGAAFNPAQDDDLIQALVAAKAIDKGCVGWEMNAYLTPAEIDILVHHIATMVNEGMGVPLYVEFIAGEMESGVGFAQFWNSHRGELTGLWFEENQGDAPGDKQGRTNDWQVRTVAGNGYGVQDSGFGHPFYLTAFENTALYQFGEALPVMSECDAGQDGYYTLCTIYSVSEPGKVPIMGFGTGAALPPSGGMI